MRHALAAIVLGLNLARPVSALECIDVFPSENVMDRAEIVLLGRVESVRFELVETNVASHNVVTVSVRQLWKGKTPSVITLQQPFVGGGIDFWTNAGKDYVLFVRTITPERPLRQNRAKPVTAGFVADECLSKPAEKFDLKLLGPSVPPEASAKPEIIRR